jgi:Cu2+-exporting ATPase
MVFAGSIACSAVAVLRIVATGSATRLSQIQRLVQEAQAQRPTLARLADRVAAYFVAVSLLLTLAVFAIWWQLEPARAFPVALAVLVAACPCALSLAVPAALSAANDALSRQGVLIVGEDALERLARVDTVLFDKTGTLTRGRPRLRNVQVFAPDLDAERALQLAAALEQDSRHPLAAAFRSERPLLVQGLQPHPGLGLEGQVQGQCLRLGRADFAAAVRDDGDLWLGDGERALARFELRDELREDAHEAMARLRALALELRIASGDGADAVGETATALRIEHTDARLSPAGKLARIRELQSQGHRVLMLGDGINDAPVLAGADVSMAMGDGSALAQRAADILLLDGALTRLPQAIALARRTQRVLRQNLCWALLYNAASLALAASGQLHPGVAALGMAASSLWVTFNALRLARPRMPRP